MKGKYLNLRSEIIRAGFTCYNVAEAIGIMSCKQLCKVSFRK